MSHPSPLHCATVLLCCTDTPRSVLKAYNISTVHPEAWEEVDHAHEGPLAGTLSAEGGGVADEMDPLGLRGRLST